MDIGTRIRNIRNQKNLSLKDIEKATNISQPVLTRLERNEKPFDINYLSLICSALNVTLAEFFAYDTELSPSLARFLQAARKLTDEERDKLTMLIEVFLQRNSK